MTKVIKEIIIMLLICLISMLILAVTLYDYIPNRKVVAKITKYNTSEEIQAQLADDIDSEEKEVILTYEVTSSDLSAYEVTNEYVPGKANPFSDYIQSVDGEVEDGDKDTTDKIDNSVEDSDSSNEDEEETDSLTTEDESIK